MTIVSSKDFPNIEAKKGKTVTHLKYNHRKIGFIKGDTFWKIPLNPKRHIYRKWNSVGIEKDILDYLERVGVRRIAVSFDGRSWLKVSRKLWVDLGKDLTYGGKLQKHLELNYIRRLAEVVYYEDWKKGDWSIKKPEAM